MKTKYTLLIIALLSLVTSCKKEKGFDESGIYLGIIGFNQELFEKKIDLLDNSSRSDFESFINGLVSDDGTILYHAVNEALNKLDDAPFPDDLESVSIVTFTDGLDLGSYILNDSYNSPNQYLTAVSSRIGSEKIKGLKINAYSIGVKGTDVIDEQQYTQNLENLASSNNNVYALNDISQVESIFRQIAASLTTESSTRSIDLTMAVPAPGALVRFTFDIIDGGDAAQSNLYIEGVFNVQGSSYSLNSIVYEGFQAGASTLTGTLSGVNVTFKFDALKEVNDLPINTSLIKQWTYVAASNQWQINSEFNPVDDIETIVDQRSTAIFLVLDCSSSLGSDFYEVQSAANSFINTLAGTSSSAGNSYECDGSYCYPSYSGIYSSSYECNLYCGGSNGGDISFWTSYDAGCGHITVEIPGYGSKIISNYYSAGITNCGFTGCANFSNIPAGTYTYYATCGVSTIENQVTVSNNYCTKVPVYF